MKSLKCDRCGGVLPIPEELGGRCARCLLEMGVMGNAQELEDGDPQNAARHPDAAIHIRSVLRSIGDGGTGNVDEGEPEQPRSPTCISDAADKDRPERLSGHRILDEIGTGGMGKVYLAMDEGLHRRVAIKTLASQYFSDSKLRARFMHEARAMAKLSHPNIVRIYNLGQSSEIPHFVMEYVDGVPLVQAGQPLTLRQKAELMYKVVMAVEFLHQNHVIHRDLKPGNILVGPDLEPRLLDFGLALDIGDRERLTRDGAVVGTPRYFSPEQARADSPLDARSDIFSLGTVLYELLTGTLPFRADTLEEEIRMICSQDPVLPRRINMTIPGGLQNICLKALEKSPAGRYGSAREMAEDLERYLAGEQPLASPTSHSRLLAGTVERHIRELEGWRRDEIISEEEFRGFAKSYNRLVDREDAWIMEARRLTISQVTLYLGAWISVVGAALIVLFKYKEFEGVLKVAIAAAAAIPMACIGVRCWSRGLLRTGIAFLLAFCFLWPIVLLIAMSEYGIAASQPDPELEFFPKIFGDYFKEITNAQLLWGFLLSLPASLWLRRFTRSAVFSLVSSVIVALICGVLLLRSGLLKWEWGDLYLHIIPVALVFFAIAMLLEAFHYPADSIYFYPIAIFFSWIALTGMAATHEGYMEFVDRWWHVGDQREYLFLINACLYFLLQGLCEKLPLKELQMTTRAFRFVIPLHVLAPVYFLGDSAMAHWKGEMPDPAYKFEARFFEILLPCASCAFVFLSVPRQMKNFFAWGMIFLAIGIVQLQHDIFEGRRSWLIGLVLGGLLVMLLAMYYANLRMMASRWLRR